MFKKSSKLFDKEGFYIVLFVCLCIVAVAAVYMSRNNANTAKKLAEGTPKVQQPAPSDATQVDNKGTDKSTPASAKPGTTGTSSTTTTKPSTPSTGTSKPASGTATVFKLDMPVKGEISADKEYTDFNPVFYPAFEAWRIHQAIDIMAPVGSEVKAGQAGKVTKVTMEDIIIDDSIETGYGVSIEIDHGTYRTVYANLSEDVKVKVGDTVKKGQLLGYIGETSTTESNKLEGDHLHFVVLQEKGKDLEPVDPNKYLPKQESKKEE